MYKTMTSQERQHKDFFYPQETMGTTIMALKYDGGVIACADSSTPFPTQEPQQEESTPSTGSLTKLTTSTSTSSPLEADWPVNPSKPSINWDFSLIPTSTSRGSCPMSKQPQECFRSPCTKRASKSDALWQDGTPMKAARSTVSIWEEHAWWEITLWEVQAVVSSTATLTQTTRKTWVSRRLKHSAFTVFPWPWKETDLQAV